MSEGHQVTASLEIRRGTFRRGVYYGADNPKDGAVMEQNGHQSRKQDQRELTKTIDSKTRTIVMLVS